MVLLANSMSVNDNKMHITHTPINGTLQVTQTRSSNTFEFLISSMGIYFEQSLISNNNSDDTGLILLTRTPINGVGGVRRRCCYGIFGTTTGCSDILFEGSNGMSTDRKETQVTHTPVNIKST